MSKKELRKLQAEIKKCEKSPTLADIRRIQQLRSQLVAKAHRKRR